MTVAEFSLTLSPLLPWEAILPLLALGLMAIAAIWWLRSRGAWWRSAAILGLLAALVNPVVVHEQRQPLTDIALLVVDESKSQAIGERKARTEAALTRLQERLSQQKDLETRVVRAGGGRSGGDGTKLFEAVQRALADVPRQRISAVVLLTDGQVHDAPQGPERQVSTAPVHGLITGDRGEADRRLIVEQSPAYGIVGKPLSLTVRVDDGPNVATGQARISIRRDGEEPNSVVVPIGQSAKIDFVLEHGGQTVYELEVERGPRELTLDNNRAVVLVNGVRDRLRVLLVTGEPHSGERTWRNLLKSDPAVDLVHFTILRPPEAQDFTPVNELSLIAFPIRELFEVKLKEFDLIIFDRYRRRDVLAQIYLDNIVRYVRGGGALMVAVGPNFGQAGSLFNSPLGQLLPGTPTGKTHEQGYRPRLSEVGRRHPVTADLPGAEAAEPSWGRWYRHVDTEPRRGHVLMNGVEQRPLLLLDRVGEGRVAQFMSDHIWLWARGYDGGGPQAELLRRVAHWLMKEPELEENDLKAVVRGDRIEINRRSVEVDNSPVEATLPNGQTSSLALTEGRGGRSSATMQVDEPGLYRFASGGRTALAAIGALNPVELADVRATDELLKVAANDSGGAVNWLVDGLPEIRRVRPGREAQGRDPGGRGWIGFRANGDYIVTEVNQVPLLPGIILFLISLGALVLAWRREGR